MTNRDPPHQPSPAALDARREVRRNPTLDETPLPELQPIASPSREQVLRQLDPPPPIGPPPKPADSPRFRFHVFDLLLAMASISAGLAGAHWLPADLYAAIFGLFTLLGMAVYHVAPPSSPGLQRACWYWLAAYFSAVLAAVFRS